MNDETVNELFITINKNLKYKEMIDQLCQALGVPKCLVSIEKEEGQDLTLFPAAGG